MRQAHLIDRTFGLRPAEKRRLESLLHRRHPKDCGADYQTLQKLGEESFLLKTSLHLVVDQRGLCRLLWVGSLDQSGKLLNCLSDIRLSAEGKWRLISCIFNSHRKKLRPQQPDSMVALDLNPLSWLLFSASKEANGQRCAARWRVERRNPEGWHLIHANDLAVLCKSASALEPIVEAHPSRSEASKEKVLLLTLLNPSKRDIERDLAELEGLVRSAGGQTVAVISQKKSAFNPQTIWGKGKLQEVALKVRCLGASLVITDRELTPVQVRNLERFLDCPVMDRSELILDIFAQRALSAAGRLQVELAQLRYTMPRLMGRGRSLSRQGGGIGTRGPGETQLEKDRRAIVRRIERLGNDLRVLKKQRALARKSRTHIPRVALVGYTNVGKSSLINALCALKTRRRVVAEDKLFATLDTTTRRLLLPKVGSSPYELLITDTVGFIRDLPGSLIEAFQATLEETLEADLLLLMVDLSNPDWRNQLDTVNALLDDLGAQSVRQVVANQIDQCASGALLEIRSLYPEVLYVSATSGAGLEGLKLWLLKHFWRSEAEFELTERSEQRHG